jgi:hypothetical protein
MIWAMENRHIMRAIEDYAIYYCWQEGRVDEALDIFRKLLQVNPQDNQGVRYNILAIRLGLSFDKWEKKFEVVEGGTIIGLDSRKLSTWFNRHYRKFPEEFYEWHRKISDLL